MIFIKNYIILLLGLLFILLGLRVPNDIKYSIDGYWLEESGSLYRIDNNKLYWYKDYNDLNDNYYVGKINIKSLKQLSYSKEKINNKYGNIDKNKFFIVKYYPKYLKENEFIKLNSKYYILYNFLLEDKNTLIIYNYNNNKEYLLTKYKKK